MLIMKWQFLVDYLPFGEKFSRTLKLFSPSIDFFFTLSQLATILILAIAYTIIMLFSRYPVQYSI